MLKKILRPIYVPIVNWHYKKFKAPRRYHHLFDEIERIKATSIVEIGTWNGNRALEMIKKAQVVSGKKVTYVGFDLFEELDDVLYKHEISKKPPSKNDVEAKLINLNAAVSLIRGNTLETLPKFITGAPKYDFIFIDGGHNIETVKNDWNCVKTLMHDKTVVIFDDYWRNRGDQSAKPIVDSIDTSIYNVEILPEVDVFDNSDFGRLEISFAKVTLK